MDDDQLESGEMCVYCGRGRKEERGEERKYKKAKRDKVERPKHIKQ